MRNLKYDKTGAVVLEIEHPVYGWIEFRASPDDTEAHGRDIYARAIAGEFGEIAPYAQPAPTAAHLSALRDAHIYGGITVAGITIGTDDQTIDRLHKAYDALKEWNPGGVKKWKAKGGFVELNMTQIGALLQAIDAHVQKCFDAESAINPANYTTTAELEAAFHAALRQ
jgi:hypothetical protein